MIYYTSNNGPDMDVVQLDEKHLHQQAVETLAHRHCFGNAMDYFNPPCIVEEPVDPQVGFLEMHSEDPARAPARVYNPELLDGTPITVGMLGAFIGAPEVGFCVVAYTSTGEKRIGLLTAAGRFAAAYCRKTLTGDYRVATLEQFFSTCPGEFNGNIAQILGKQVSAADPGRATVDTPFGPLDPRSVNTRLESFSRAAAKAFADAHPEVEHAGFFVVKGDQYSHIQWVSAPALVIDSRHAVLVLFDARMSPENFATLISFLKDAWASNWQAKVQQVQARASEPVPAPPPPPPPKAKAVAAPKAAAPKAKAAAHKAKVAPKAKAVSRVDPILDYQQPPKAPKAVVCTIEQDQDEIDRLSQTVIPPLRALVDGFDATIEDLESKLGAIVAAAKAVNWADNAEEQHVLEADLRKARKERRAANALLGDYERMLENLQV